MQTKIVFFRDKRRFAMKFVGLDNGGPLPCLVLEALGVIIKYDAVRYCAVSVLVSNHRDFLLRDGITSGLRCR